MAFAGVAYTSHAHGGGDGGGVLGHGPEPPASRTSSKGDGLNGHELARSDANTVSRSGVEHSWAGEDTFTQYGDWIVGSDSSFGKSKHLVYSNNGTEQSPDTECIEPHFDMGMNQVALVKTESRYTFSDRRDYEERWNLYILLKGGELQVSDKIKRIMEEFNI